MGAGHAYRVGVGLAPGRGRVGREGGATLARAGCTREMSTPEWQLREPIDWVVTGVRAERRKVRKAVEHSKALCRSYHVQKG